ncbi:MAG: HAD-IIIA family hydrolase, partial [Gammaproteobacteria bacterium]|nr:HAD-IIIA family hydrolase [Gammaproteobacteria bacterium]
GISRGYYSEDTLHKMHEKMASLLEPLKGKVDSIFFCPHGPDDLCNCRKPKPGLYQQISRHFGIPLDCVFVVGDSYRDLEAAMAVNAKPVLVKTGKGQNTLEKHQKDLTNNNIPVFNDLKDAVNHILSENS